jgi:hypothetical protein
VIFLLNTSFEKAIDTYTNLVQEQFAAKSPETPANYRNAVRRLNEKFRETGSVLDAERSGGPSKLNDEKLLDISDSMLRSPSKLLLKLAQEGAIGLATAHKAVRKQLNSERYCSTLYDFIGLLEEDEITYS